MSANALSACALVSRMIDADKSVCLSPDASAALAAKKMAEKQTSAVVVTFGGKLFGIVTEQDIISKVVAADQNAADTTLFEIMTEFPDAVTTDASTLDALNLMQENGYRHVPVVAKGDVVGMVSVRDIFNEVRAGMEETLRSLDEFIFGSSYSVPNAAYAG